MYTEIPQLKDNSLAGTCILGKTQRDQSLVKTNMEVFSGVSRGPLFTLLLGIVVALGNPDFSCISWSFLH